MPQMKKISIPIVVLSVFLFSCSSEEDASFRFADDTNELDLVDDQIDMVDDTVDSELVTYTDDVAPILENYCTNCHGANTSRSGISVHTYDLAVTYSNEIKSVIEVDYMPTGSPMLDEDKEVIYQWIEDGLVE